MRESINDNWRFQRGEPAGQTDRLRYDVRPEVTESSDGKPADAKSDAADATGSASGSVLKPWILPTGNALILDPARRHRRPAEELHLDIPYLAAGFDDSAWERVTLPHDWAIAGLFLESGPYGGMGRLPSWGIGWYRKKLSIPAAEQGKSIFLDIDGAMSYATVWLNGHIVGGWPFGYSSWRVDLTPYVVPGGTNELAIRLDNRSREPFTYRISSNQPWIRLSTAGGTIEKSQRVEVDVQWSQVPIGASRTELTITGPANAKVTVSVPIHNPAALRPEQAAGHVESRGVIAMEAEHYSAASNAGGRSWLKIPEYGHTLSGMTVTPALGPALELRDGMQLQYAVPVFNPGMLRVEAVMGPTLKFTPGSGFRYAISFDDEPPQVVNIHSDESEAYWNKMVSDGVARFTSEHVVKTVGPHTLKFWALDTGLVLQRLIVDTGGLKTSYLGPPESPYFTGVVGSNAGQKAQ